MDDVAYVVAVTVQGVVVTLDAVAHLSELIHNENDKRNLYSHHSNSFQLREQKTVPNINSLL